MISIKNFEEIINNNKFTAAAVELSGQNYQGLKIENAVLPLLNISKSNFSKSIFNNAVFNSEIYESPSGEITIIESTNAKWTNNSTASVVNLLLFIISSKFFMLIIFFSFFLSSYF